VARVLAADIGGTNCRLALFEDGQLVDRERLPTSGPSFAAATAPWLAGRGLDAAGVAVAGPVRSGRAALTNHPWAFDESSLARALGAPTVLLNDFAAAVRGVPELRAGSWHHLAGPLPDRKATLVAVGPGTGLGQAALVATSHGWLTLPSEAGHMDLAPGTHEDLDLWRTLAGLHGHVSWERVLSGPGLLALYAARSASDADAPTLDQPAHVTASALPAARAAVDDFARLLGAFAGNAALSMLPSGGVWLCGGIVPRILDRLDSTIRAFHAKGRLSETVQRVPLCAVVDDDLGLRGAAAAARSALS